MQARWWQRTGAALTRGRRVAVGLGLAFAAGAAEPQGPQAAEREQERVAMVAAVAAMARDTAHVTKRPTLAPRTMAALAAVPRHRFVPAGLAHEAYDNRPLPIGHGQTISQPYVVALMTDLAAVGPEDKVLEVGTGSGYQAAVLAQLARNVYSVEIVEPLAREAAARLSALGYANVEVTAGDGYRGRPDRAPFDAIVVTAGAPRVPQPLVDQLKPGGRMVIPVDRSVGQDLVLLVKREDGSLARTVVLPVRFVPLTGPGIAGPR